MADYSSSAVFSLLNFIAVSDKKLINTHTKYFCNHIQFFIICKTKLTLWF